MASICRGKSGVEIFLDNHTALRLLHEQSSSVLEYRRTMPSEMVIPVVYIHIWGRVVKADNTTTGKCTLICGALLDGDFRQQMDNIITV